MYRLFFFCFLLPCTTAFVQPPAPFTFAHYGMNNGLLSNEIMGVAQDRTGYLWIGSNNGLQRYDGVHYKTFQHRDDDPHSLPVNFVVQLLFAQDDKLWLLFADGETGWFDTNNFRFTPVQVHVQRAASLGAIKFLTNDSDGRVFYILHGNELLMYDPKENAFVSARPFFHLESSQTITWLAQKPGTKKYWLGLLNGGVAVYNLQTGRLSYPGNNREHEAAVDSLSPFPAPGHFIFDNQGRFWAESWDKKIFPHVIRFDETSKGRKLRLYEFLTTLNTYNEVHGISQQRDGTVWVYGAPLLGRYNEAEDGFELMPSDSRSGQGIAYDRVSGVYEDREMNVWIATGNNGLYRCNPSQQFFSNVPHRNPRNQSPGKGSIMSFAELKNGDVLVGSWGDGIFRYNNQWKEVPLNIKSKAPFRLAMMWSMCPSADNNTVWMGAQPGLFRYNQAAGTITYRNPAALQNRTVRQVAEDPDGNLWLGMQHYGLYKWLSPKSEKGDSLIQIPAVGKDLVTKVVKDASGWMWVSAESKGVFAFEAKTGQLRFHWTDRLAKDSAKIMEGFTSVLPYNDSLVYISTATKLYAFNRRNGRVSQQPMPGAILGAIAALEKDGNGALWISTTNGLYRYIPPRKIMVFFNRDDGIANDRFIGGAALRMKNGRLLFGADNSFIHFDPSKMKAGAQEQKVVLTNIQVGHRELPVDSVMGLGVLKLGAAENSLTVDFSSLSFAAIGPVQYRLDGIDRDWQTADRDNRATFPFLPAGRYSLLLRTVNAEGMPSAATALRIQVAAPFYQTWWSYTLLGVVTAAFLFWLDRQRTKRKEALQKVRTDIAGGLHQEVNTALNNINILSEIARLKSEREPQKAKDYLEQIHTKSHNMMVALDDMLWSLDPENDAMDKTIQRIHEYTDALMQRHGAVIELLISTLR